MKILLGTTGSVAAILTPKLIGQLVKAGHEVEVAATEPSLYFWKKEQVGVPVWRDRDEWPETGYRLSDPIRHIELRRWAEVALIAPLSANTLAKLATGQADNLLTCAMRAWDSTRSVVVAPAMNTHMWDHPATAIQLRQLEVWYPYLQVVQPVSKRLACGDVGVGAMASVEEICRVIASLQPTS